MRILLLMDPFVPVPPVHYGGIERVISDIAHAYIRKGHAVTLVAGPNSHSPGKLITYGENGEGYMRINYTTLAKVASILYRELPRHDVVHNFGRLAFMFPIAWSGIRKIQTYMRTITPSNIRRLNQLGCRNIIFTAVSDAIAGTGSPGGGTWRTVYNCAPVHRYTYRSSVSSDAPLVFLGRLERCKGAHTAIEVAKKSGRRLLIAGNISNLPHEQAYFHKELVPIIDGELIRYIGEVNDEQKNELLGNAAALLTPVEWFEPFPVILPEAFACGTPVLAFPNGGVPEGIRPGITGWLSNSVDEMVKHVGRINELSRHACRMDAENRYSDSVIAGEYLKLYSERPGGAIDH